MRTNTTKGFPGRITEKRFTSSVPWESFHEMFLKPVWTFICLIKQKGNHRSLDAIRSTAVWENPTHTECEASIPALVIEGNSAFRAWCLSTNALLSVMWEGVGKSIASLYPWVSKSSCLGQVGSHEVWVNSGQNWEQKSKKKYWKLATNLCLRHTCVFYTGKFSYLPLWFISTD